MGKKLFAIFTIVPLIELALLVALGDAMGLKATLALVMTTGIAGAYLAKHEGLRVLRSWQDSIATGAIPTDGIMNGALVLVGGVLLITPGILTDALGISLLVAPSRRAIASIIKVYLLKMIESGEIQVGMLGGVNRRSESQAQPDTIIEVSSIRIPTPPTRRPPTVDD